MHPLLEGLVVVSNEQRLRIIQRLAIELEKQYSQPLPINKERIKTLTEDLQEEVNSLLKNTIE